MCMTIHLGFERTQKRQRRFECTAGTYRSFEPHLSSKNKHCLVLQEHSPCPSHTTAAQSEPSEHLHKASTLIASLGDGQPSRQNCPEGTSGASATLRGHRGVGYTSHAFPSRRGAPTQHPQVWHLCRPLFRAVHAHSSSTSPLLLRAGMEKRTCDSP